MTRKPADRLPYLIPVLAIVAGGVILAILTVIAVGAVSRPALVEVEHRMNDGRTVLCIVNTDGGGVDCDWDEAA
jgi:hypothetical protein